MSTKTSPPKNSEEFQKDSQVKAPSITLPKGGGAIRGIGEKFAANPVTGTGFMTVPIAVSPGRAGFGPQLSLSYDSGSGNGPFGLGWNLSLPSITLKTDKGLPKYQDGNESDTFILSGVEDLVPVLKQQDNDWLPEDIPDRTVGTDTYRIKRYRPRIEGLFARIERWTNTLTNETHWRSISGDNIATLYGGTTDSRIDDPDAPDGFPRVFSWLICESYDDKGNAIYYKYEPEDSAEIDLTQTNERNRTDKSRSANRYLKQIKYGNKTPVELDSNLPREFREDLSERTDWLFEVVFDYEEGHYKELPADPNAHQFVNARIDPTQDWQRRQDPFSSFRSGFEVRTYRLCHRVLMFHHFPDELDVDDYLVRSTGFKYKEGPIASFITSVTQSGYKLQDDGTYLEKSFPPLEFEYSEVSIQDKVEDVDEESIENLPQGLDGAQYQWVDIDGEGSSGILTEQGDSWFYKRNISALPVIDEDGEPYAVARFAPIEHLATIPSFTNLSGGRQQLLDLAGDGQLDVVEFDSPTPGFFERTKDKAWHTFKPFESLPNIPWDDPNLKFVDLTGDGHADIFITEDEAFTWYQSLAETGFASGERVRQAIDEEKGPKLVFSDGTQSIYLADISGDGLTDLVRIRNGEICYWPNLGYGRFGVKVTMDNSPLFDAPDHFDQRRIRLADIDGSGVTDIIYLKGNGVYIYLNESGNRWADAEKLKSFPHIDNLSSVIAVDLLGNGTACLVWSSPLPGHARKPMRYIDLMGGQKPHLLVKTVNNLGAETHVHYVPSTKFYLADKLAGKPWITKIPFPVHVVERVETIDCISRNRFVTRYAYHHGYFDGVEREFRGFGMVEQWDTDLYGTFKEKAAFAAHASNWDEDSHVPPVYTRTWFHTGFYQKRDAISKHFSAEYFNKDKIAWEFPDTVLPDGLSADEIREACRALKGSMLRQEIYAEDNRKESKNPYLVTENKFHIRRVQPRKDNRHGVFYVYESEALDYYYERNPDDPRIAHQMVLEVDKYGQATKEAGIVYPRRNPQYDEQKKLLITYTENELINADDKTDYCHLGLPEETRTFEITGINQKAGEPFKLAELKKNILNAAKISYEDKPNISVIEKRLIEHSKVIYYNEKLTGPLPQGQIAFHGLPYETYLLAFSPALLNKAFGTKINNNILKIEGGYLFQDNGWWKPSGHQEFDAANFYLPKAAIDPFGNRTEITYDVYNLLMKKTKDPLGNTVTAENDYRVLQPCKMTDPNKNRGAVVFDTLGMVVKTAVMGKENAGEGDTLQDPTTKLEYDLFNWKKNNKPNYVKIQARERHGPANPRWQVSYTYSDGFGREIMQKVQAEPGKARTLNAQGAVVEVQANPRWTGTGRTIFNNKGKPVKQYEPYFSVTHEYEDEKKLVEYGVTPVIHYDPLERVIRTDLPDGTYTKVEFDPWMQKNFDQNDTAYDLADTTKSSKWYKENIALPNTDAGFRTAKLTEAHADTPQVVHLDTLGRPFLTVDDNGTFGKYETHVKLDIEGNQLEIKDAKYRTIAKNIIDISGQQIYSWSADGGENRALNDVLDNPIRSWDSEGHGFRAKYDKLQRPTHLLVNKDNGPEVLVEFTIYGENVKNAEDVNLKGEVYQQYDQAGSVTNHEFDFKGNLKKSARRLAKNYKQTIDWVALDNVPKTQGNLLNITVIDNTANQFLEIESFTSKTTFDALNRPVALATPDKSITYPGYNEANLLEKVEVNRKASGQKILFVKNINYNEKGQRTLIEYANAVAAGSAQTSIKTEYGYDKETFRLTHMKTTRSSDNAKLQDLQYTYDPIGNITHIRDDAHQPVFFNNAKVEPHTKYKYDPLYRLIHAEGREHGGQLPQPQRQRTHKDFPLNDIPQPNNPEALRTYTESYVYDAVGNIMKMIHTAKNGSWTRGYRYDEKGTNRLTSTSQPGDDPLGSFSGIYKHDKNGNMTKMPHLSTLKWDHEDQLKEVALGGGGKAFYTYDSEGARVRKVAVYQNSGVKERIYLGGYEIFREYVSETAMASGNIKNERETMHVMDDKQRIALVETETHKNSLVINNPQPRIRYQFSNHLGSASIETDPEGKVITFEEYYPYGGTAYHAVKSGIEVSAKRYRYNGKEKDEESGLYYYGARYYAAWLGRWTKPDPLCLASADIAVVGQLSSTADEQDQDSGYHINLYIAFDSNPVRFVDPDGLAARETFWSKLGRYWTKFSTITRALNLMIRGVPEEHLATEPEIARQNRPVTEVRRTERVASGGGGKPPKPTRLPKLQISFDVKVDERRRQYRARWQKLDFDTTIREFVDKSQREQMRGPRPSGGGRGGGGGGGPRRPPSQGMPPTDPGGGGGGVGGLFGGVIGGMLLVLDINKAIDEAWHNTEVILEKLREQRQQYRRVKHMDIVHSAYAYFAKQLVKKRLLAKERVSPPHHWSTSTVREETVKLIRKLIRESNANWYFLKKICQFQKQTGTSVLRQAYCAP